MNATNDKLIFRSVPNKRYTVSDTAGVQLNPDKQKKTSVPAFDGYCYILFGESASEDGVTGGDESNKHHAVVESANEGFKKAIIYALSHMA
jgi:hypothetical protein